jgi:ribosomal protein L11 methyltransferase
MTIPPQNWLEITIATDSEVAEAISEAIYSHVEGGVALEQVNYDDRAEDRWEDETPTGPVVVRAYLPMDETLPQRRAEVERALRCLNLIRPVPAPAYRPIAQADWAEAWKAAFKPVRIGRRILVRPSWIDVAPEPGDVMITLDPGLAFGTGLHPTTQLCALALEERMRPGMRVLDVGTGSGILAILAAKLGAAAVLGVDIDTEAVRAARENVRANGAAEIAVIEAGSAGQARGTYDLVIANILAGVILRLLGEGLGRLGRDFVFSGILETQAADVQKALDEAGLRLVERKQMADWVCLVCRRADAPDEPR